MDSSIGYGETFISKTASISSNLNYRADIDGLRAIAVLGVILWHAGFSAQGRLITPGGFLGVDVFFVISGFLMARIWDNGVGLGDFFKRRLRRILPMLFVTILACIPFALLLMGPSALADFGMDAKASAWLVPNIFYAFQDSYWAAPNKMRPLLHLWTIGVEMQFYLLCPPIFITVRKWIKPVLGLSLLSALSFGLALWLSRTHPDIAFFNLPTRLWEFTFGALVFYSPLTKIRSTIFWVIGFTLIIVSFIVLNESIAHPAELTLLPVIGTCLVISSGNAFPKNILAMPFLRRIGILSFSAYLIHQPLFVFTRIVMEQADLPNHLSFGLIVLTFIISEFTYRFIETPLRRPSFKKAAIIAALGLMAFTGGLGLSFPSGPSENTEALLVKPDRWILEAGGTRCVNKDISHPCRLGHSEIEPTIALLGDSHMQAMAGGFDELFTSQNLNDIDYSLGGCPFIMGVRRYARKYPCDEFVEDVFSQLALRKIKTVIILDRRNAYLLGEGATFNDGTKELADVRIYPVQSGPDGAAASQKATIEDLHIETITRLREMGIKVILIYPVPEIGIHVPDTLVKRIKAKNLPLTLDRKLHDARQTPLLALKELAAKDKDILEIDPTETFCDDKYCLTHNHENVYYTDRDHISRQGTELFLSGAEQDILDFLK